MADALCALSVKKAGHHVISLNRPDKLNSFNERQHIDLTAALDAAEADRSCRAVILTGAGRGFCAGQDLGERIAADSAATGDGPSDALGRYYNPLIRRLSAFPVPVICAVNGIAAGAGASIALNCDIVLAARSAKFLQPFSRIGLIPDAGGTWILPRLVGPGRARALAMLADTIDAETAERWGMVYKVVDDAALMGEAGAMAERLAALPVGALVAVRKALAAAETYILKMA